MNESYLNGSVSVFFRVCSHSKICRCEHIIEHGVKETWTITKQQKSKKRRKRTPTGLNILTKSIFRLWQHIKSKKSERTENSRAEWDICVLQRSSEPQITEFGREAVVRRCHTTSPHRRLPVYKRVTLLSCLPPAWLRVGRALQSPASAFVFLWPEMLMRPVLTGTACHVRRRRSAADDGSLFNPWTPPLWWWWWTSCQGLSPERKAELCHWETHSLKTDTFPLGKQGDIFCSEAWGWWSHPVIEAFGTLTTLSSC